MSRPTRRFIVLIALVSAIPIDAARSQSLPDSLVQRIHAGASHMVLPRDSVVLPLVSTSTLPVVEASVNGTGPYRFLVDLGSNVTLLRRDVVDASRSAVLVDRATSDIVHADVVGLGDARLVDVTAGSYDELDVEGVLGYNVLRYTSFTLDLPGQRLVLHHRSLPPPDGEELFSYRLQDRLPYVMIHLGSDSLLVNLDTGATEWMTVPPGLQPRLRWLAPPVPGRTVFNNQTGSRRVLEGRLADTLRFGGLVVATPLVYVNADAEEAWIGSAAMRHAIWTFDPAHRRVRVIVPRPRQ